MTKLSKAQAGSIGGKATVARHGRAHMVAIGRRGAQAFWKKYTLRPVNLADFAIVERTTGRAVNLLYQSWNFKKQTATNERQSIVAAQAQLSNE